MSVVCEVCFFYSVFLDWTAEFTLNHCATGSSFVIAESALEKTWPGAHLCCASVFMSTHVCVCAPLFMSTHRLGRMLLVFLGLLSVIVIPPNKDVE